MLNKLYSLSETLVRYNEDIGNKEKILKILKWINIRFYPVLKRFLQAEISVAVYRNSCNNEENVKKLRN